MDLNPVKLVLRCYARRDGDQWVAVCMDLTLAAQADTFEEARKKLQAQIADYVYDATVGEDRDHIADLIPRRAPLVEWARYYKYWTLFHVGWLRDNIRRLFTLPLPVYPLRTV